MTFPQQRNGDIDGSRPPTLAARAAKRVWADIRPLDPVRSIKGKLALLVIVSVFLATGMVVVAIRSETQIRIIMIFSMIASLLFMQFLAHGLTAPLRDMTAAARAMASGDYSRRVEVNSRDEIGELAATFNQMASDLEASDRHRRELVANVSHELRTPIAALRAVLENVVDGVVQPNPATLGAALEQTERLGRLVTHLLDLSKIDGGVVDLDARPFEVREFLDGVLRGVTVDGATAAWGLLPARRRPARPGGQPDRADRRRRHRTAPPGGGQPGRQRLQALPARRHRDGAGQTRRGAGGPAAGGRGRGSRHPGGGPGQGLRAVRPQRHRDRGRAGRRRRDRPGPGHRPLGGGPARRADRGRRGRARLPDRGPAARPALTALRVVGPGPDPRRGRAVRTGTDVTDPTQCTKRIDAPLCPYLSEFEW